MRSLRSVSISGLICGLAALALVALTAQGALAQVSLNPTDTPIQNNSPTGPLGPLPSIAAIMFGRGVVSLILMIGAYMRYAPRFSRDEEQLKVVRADRVRLGQELPRRAVDISQAVPVVVGPPPIAPGAPAASAAEERPEVSLDEEVFQQTLEELLAKGTSRRVAEGQARRAAMIAARKKAGG